MQTLLVDDDVEMRLLLGEVLRARGHEVLACADAETAWAAYQEEAYPLALLDLSLPGMDGLQLCRQMRTLPHGDGSIILVITGRDQSEDLEAVLEAGANDYLAKPVDISLLDVRLTIAEQQVHMLTERKRAEAALARAYEREVEIGARVQQTLLQGQPPHHLPWIRIATLILPSQRIDGDFYDFFVYPDRCLDVMVGDVMGKGVPAALLGAATKSQFLHALCHLIAAPDRVRRPSPADIVSAVHAGTTQQLINLESFITLCYAQFDLEKRQVDFVNCGHPKTIHFRPRIGRCEPLQVDNMPLGFSEHEVYKQISVPFEAGDTFVFYSDGVTESRDETGEFFGEDRLMGCIQAHGKGEPQALIDEIRTTLHAFTNTTMVADDVTCIVVQIKALEAARPIEHLVFETSSELAQLSRLRAFVRQVCQDLPPPALDEDSISQLELAVNEAASNIMIHA